jgi:alpha-muurolene/germacrene-A/gamma-muurolene synthase
MIPILVCTEGRDLQSAVDAVGELCKSSIERFITGRALLPTWGAGVDHAVEQYVLGLQDWIVGTHL